MFRWLIHELVIMYKVSIQYLQIPNECNPFKRGYFKRYVRQASSTIDQRSLTLPSTNYVTKETKSEGGNS